MKHVNGLDKWLNEEPDHSWLDDFDWDIEVEEMNFPVFSGVNIDREKDKEVGIEVCYENQVKNRPLPDYKEWSYSWVDIYEDLMEAGMTFVATIEDGQSIMEAAAIVQQEQIHWDMVLQFHTIRYTANSIDHINIDIRV